MYKMRPGEIIRHKATREPFLVINKSPQGLLVVNLLLRTDPATVQIILPRALSNFEPDIEMVDMTKDEATILKTKMEIVESVQETLLQDDD